MQRAQECYEDAVSLPTRNPITKLTNMRITTKSSITFLHVLRQLPVFLLLELKHLIAPVSARARVEPESINFRSTFRAAMQTRWAH